MELNAEQQRIVTMPPKGHQQIKGAFGSGKTVVGLSRGRYLLNNYCFSRDDTVLLTAYSPTQVDYMAHLFTKIKACQGDTLPFVFENDHKLDVSSVDSLMLSQFQAWGEQDNLKLSVAFSDVLGEQIIREGVAAIQPGFPRLSVLNPKNAKLLLKEIRWIKSCLYLREAAYQDAPRKGLSKRGAGACLPLLRKHSPVRRAIFQLMGYYDNALKDRGLIDYGEMRAQALDRTRVKPLKQYTHIIVDESQELTFSQLLFLKEIYRDKVYSSMLFITDTSRSVSPRAWLGAGRSFTSIGVSMKGRSHTLSVNSATGIRRLKGDVPGNEALNPGRVELNYTNFKTGQAASLSFDPDAPTCLELDQQGESERLEGDQLSKLPVYGEIQAGLPVEMNPESGETIYLPEDWTRGAEHFALQVNGDSMTGADINEGDLVVIRRQNTADNLDIVAVALGDEATLKRFKKAGSTAVLTAENPKYDPIVLDGEQVAILGRAVGVIKRIRR